MTETSDYEKTNFLLWYEITGDSEKEKAKRVNIEKYRELVAKYKDEIDLINIRKELLFTSYRGIQGLFGRDTENLHFFPLRSLRLCGETKQWQKKKN